MEFVIDRQEALIDVGGFLTDQHLDEKIWVFKGEMGAGKTTLIKSICEILKVEDEHFN